MLLIFRWGHNVVRVVPRGGEPTCPGCGGVGEWWIVLRYHYFRFMVVFGVASKKEWGVQCAHCGLISTTPDADARATGAEIHRRFRGSPIPWSDRFGLLIVILMVAGDLTLGTVARVTYSALIWPVLVGLLIERRRTPGARLCPASEIHV